MLAHFPSYFRGHDGLSIPFADYHKELWDWIWALERGTRPPPFIAVWARGSGKSTTAELACVAVGARQTRRYVLYICANQEQADTHVLNVSQMLESRTLTARYPALASRKLNKYGRPLGWRRNRLQTASRLTVDALGFDVALRGLRIDEDRPDLIILDDIDSIKDSAQMVQKKIEQLTKSIIPAGSADLAVLGVQNLVHESSIFSQLVDGRADFLAKKHISGPYPALQDLRFEKQPGVPTRLTAGVPTWAGMDLARCQAMVEDMGFLAFMAECQHERQYLHGKMYAEVWHPSVHVVEPFPIPLNWYVDRAHDWGSSAPFATLWFAEANGEEIELPGGAKRHWPKGTVFVIAEDYGWSGKPNEGLRLTNVAIAQRIKTKETYLAMPGRIKAGPADSMIFDVTNGTSIATEYESVGVRFTKAQKGPGSRATGWKMIYDRLVAATKAPMEYPGLFVFTTCPQTIRTLPLLPRDPLDPDNVDSSSEDHIGDGLRYRLLHKRITGGYVPLTGH